MTAVLELREVSKKFTLSDGAAVHAAVNVSLSVEAGETVALVGESGCGKSTVSNLAMRMLEPDTGKVLLEGTDVSHLSRRAMRQHRSSAQMVFQDPFASLDPRRNIGQAIEEPLLVQGRGTREERRARVAELLELVGLPAEMASRFPHEFSGGQRQRICIARALALNPALVVADEAVSALDVSVRATVLNLFLELQEQLGLAYLFVSHDLAVVERIAHRVAVMYLGQIVEIGPREAVFGNPSHEYTRRLLASVPVADPRARTRRSLDERELPSPVWSRGTAPTPVQLVEVGPGHFAAAAEAPR